MPTKRERLENLTAAMQANIDDGPAQLAALGVDIAALTTDIATTQAEIDVITAIAANSRTAAQKVDLSNMRKSIALMRVLKSSLQLNKKLIRNDMVTSRYGLFLDGSRVRDTDVNGNE